MQMSSSSCIPQSVFPRYLSLPLSLLKSGGSCCCNSTSHLSQWSQFHTCRKSNSWLSLIATWGSKYIIGRSAVAPHFPLDVFFFHPPDLLKSVVITIPLCLYYNLSLITLPCDFKHLVNSWVLDVILYFILFPLLIFPPKPLWIPVNFLPLSCFISYKHPLCPLLVQASPCPVVGSPSRGYPLVPPVYFVTFHFALFSGNKCTFCFLAHVL